MSAFHITDPCIYYDMGTLSDISENLMQCMQNDIASLKSASLVCQSWHSASQMWIFRKLVLDQAKYNNLMVLSQDPNSCSFTAHCRTLEVHATDVRTITPSFVTLFPSITEFHLQATSLPSLKDLFEFISRFPKVHSVTLDNVSWIHTAPTPLPSIPTVEYLKVQGDMKYNQLFEQLEEFKVFPRLLKLAAGPIEESDLPSLGVYVNGRDALFHIKSITMSLVVKEHASVPLPSQLFQSDKEVIAADDALLLHNTYRSIYGFNPCILPLPHIRHLGIKGFLDVRNAFQNTALLWTPRFLTAMRIPNVRCIELDLFIDHAGQLDQYGVHWPFIDFALTTPGFSNLRKVVFIVLGSSDLMSVADLLCQRLPLASERELVYLCLGEDGYDQSATTFSNRPPGMM